MSDLGIGRHRKQLECACKNKVFSIVVSPIIANGSAEIVEVYCVVCQKGVNVGKGILGAKHVRPENTVHTDKNGKRHHRMFADPLDIGFSGGNIGGSNGSK